MLNIRNELLDDLKIEKNLPFDNESVEVLNLIKEHNLVQDITFLNTLESQYQAIIDYMIYLYLNNKDIPLDVKEFTKTSSSFRVYLLEFIQNKMETMINESSSHFFKEIYVLLNLLSNTKKYQLLTNDNTFSLSDIESLLNEYEDNICEVFIKNNLSLYNIWFKYYQTLLELLNINCVINSLDIQRRKNVNKLLELVTSTISRLKNKIKLPEKDVVSLNAVLGKQLLYFTNITFIPIDNNNKDTVIQKYAFMLKKIVDGYKLLNHDDLYYLTYIDNLTTLILTLVYKLKTKLHIKDIEFNQSKELNEIYQHYNRSVKEEQKIQALTLCEFQSQLLENYKYLYIKLEKYEVSKEIDLISIFIKKDEISNIDMLLIYNTVLYTDIIQRDVLDSILHKLLSKEKFDNDYYEFYKLKIIDRVIQKYIILRISTSSNKYLDDIIKYIEKNNTISHLMSMYAKIYLSLSLYYSYEKISSSLKLSKKYYFIYKRLDSSNFLESEFYTISKQILSNIGNNYIKEFNFRIPKQFTTSEAVQIGKEQMSQYIKYKDLKLKDEINNSLQNLIEEIILINEPNEKWLNENIKELISNKIFLGIANVQIKNIEDKNLDLEVGYGVYSIQIHDEYYLFLNYSSYYRNLFEKILEKNRKVLERDIKNLYASYLNSIPSYFDTTTKLPNMSKLKNVLKDLDKKPSICFIEIYLESLVTFSESYNVKISNEFFRIIANAISNSYETYRLFGPKLGIILDENKNYNEIVNFLNTLKVNFKDETFNIKSIIAVSYGNSNTILDKSFYALSSAKISNDKLYIYD